MHIVVLLTLLSPVYSVVCVNIFWAGVGPHRLYFLLEILLETDTKGVLMYLKGLYQRRRFREDASYLNQAEDQYILTV